MTGDNPLAVETLPDDPLGVVEAWLDEALAGRKQPNPNSMVLATTGPGNTPSARVVLLKQLVTEPGFAIFYSNYQSRKGLALATQQRAAAVLHWDKPGRQIRLEGLVVKSPGQESDAYFASRPWTNRIAAWASDQSKPIDSRSDLIRQTIERAAAFGVVLDESLKFPELDPPPEIPRPPHWGGYRLWLDAVEIWVHGDARLHDRAVWTRDLVSKGSDAFDTGPWSVERLQP